MESEPEEPDIGVEPDDMPDDEPGVALGVCVLVSGDGIEPGVPCAEGIAEEPEDPVDPVMPVLPDVPDDPDVWA